MSQLYGYCPKCKELKMLTKHHIYPRRYFKKIRDVAICHLCRECHNDIEYIISKRERGKKLQKHIYYNILVSFIND